MLMKCKASLYYTSTLCHQITSSEKLGWKLESAISKRNFYAIKIYLKTERSSKFEVSMK